MTKIGVTTSIFHPQTGGPATYLYHLLPQLQANGHDVRVLTYGEPSAHDYGYPVQFITRTTPQPLRFLHYTRALIALAQWAEVLYVNGYVLPLLLPFPRPRVVAKMVGDFSWEYAYRNGLTDLDVVAFQTAAKPPKLAFIRALYTRALRRPQAVIVPSEHLARIVRSMGVKNVHVVYNGIPDSGLHTADRAALRRELGLPLDVPLLIAVGRLIAIKGVDVMMRALHHLPPHYHAVIIGEGDEQPALEALAPAGRVQFLGRKEHADVLRYLRAADVFVLSSRTEGLAHVLLEAQSVGTPAVATQVGGNPEVITSGENGLLVPSEDPQALAAAIAQIIEDPARAAQFATAGRLRSADFLWENTVKQTEALICAPPLDHS